MFLAVLKYSSVCVSNISCHFCISGILLSQNSLKSLKFSISLSLIFIFIHPSTLILTRDLYNLIIHSTPQSPSLLHSDSVFLSSFSLSSLSSAIPAISLTTASSFSSILPTSCLFSSSLSPVSVSFVSVISIDQI